VNAEDRFVDAVRALLPAGGPVRVGPGDDAALLDRDAGMLAATTDMLVENVDFLPDEAPDVLGRRAVSVNLSDLAAMGAEPEALLLAIGFDPRRGADYALAITRAAAQRASTFGARLVGGDLSDAPVTVLSVAAWGRPAGPPLMRTGARPGDLVFLTGWPGEAAAGLRVARRGAAGLTEETRDALLQAYRDPEPRIALGAALSRQGLATAAIDVSDGVGIDTGRLARASGVRIVLERSGLPLSSALRAFAEQEGLDPAELALSGGDDYELLFTVPSSGAGGVAEAARALRLEVRQIGRVEEGSGAAVADGGRLRDVTHLGHDHFERAS
jgi:thiamine-monophosphate kinase